MTWYVAQQPRRCHKYCKKTVSCAEGCVKKRRWGGLKKGGKSRISKPNFLGIVAARTAFKEAMGQAGEKVEALAHDPVKLKKAEADFSEAFKA